MGFFSFLMSAVFRLLPPQGGESVAPYQAFGAHPLMQITEVLHIMHCSKSLYTNITPFFPTLQADPSDSANDDKSITKFNKFSPDFLCILAQHKQAVKFCFLAASFIRSVLPILSSRPAFPAMRSLSYIMVTLLFVMRSAPVPAGIGGTWSPHSYTRESSGGSC